MEDLTNGQNGLVRFFLRCVYGAVGRDKRQQFSLGASLRSFALECLSNAYQKRASLEPFRAQCPLGVYQSGVSLLCCNSRQETRLDHRLQAQEILPVALYRKEGLRCYPVVHYTASL